MMVYKGSCLSFSSFLCCLKTWVSTIYCEQWHKQLGHVDMAPWLLILMEDTWQLPILNCTKVEKDVEHASRFNVHIQHLMIF